MESGATIDCGVTRYAVGGGAFSGGNAIYRSHPSDASGNLLHDDTANPRYWTVKLASIGTGQAVYALCLDN